MSPATKCHGHPSRASLGPCQGSAKRTRLRLPRRVLPPGSCCCPDIRSIGFLVDMQESQARIEGCVLLAVFWLPFGASTFWLSIVLILLRSKVSCLEGLRSHPSSMIDSRRYRKEAILHGRIRASLLNKTSRWILMFAFGIFGQAKTLRIGHALTQKDIWEVAEASCSCARWQPMQFSPVLCLMLGEEPYGR